jgi:predicted peptidase
MGGYATWQLAMNNPQYFAAIVPICGGGMYWNAERLKHIPIWAHHGNKDERVDVSESIKMVDAICKKGGNAKLTIYEGVGHNCWDATYKNPEVFHWLLENVNENSPVITSDYHDSKLYG